MKTEEQIREALRNIRDGADANRIESRYATAQVQILAWVLDALPPWAERFASLAARGELDRLHLHAVTVTDDDIKESEEAIYSI